MREPLHNDFVELVELLIFYDPLLEHKAQQIQLQGFRMLKRFITNSI